MLITTAERIRLIKRQMKQADLPIMDQVARSFNFERLDQVFAERPGRKHQQAPPEAVSGLITERRTARQMGRF